MMGNLIKIPVKIGWELVILLNLLLLFALNDVIKRDTWEGLWIMIPVLVFVNYVFFSIKYTINKNKLIIKGSVFSTTQIDISSINKIEKTWNPISSPAPSLFGRVEIYYGKESIVISPKDFTFSKNEILQINPNIIVKE